MASGTEGPPAPPSPGAASVAVSSASWAIPEAAASGGISFIESKVLKHLLAELRIHGGAAQYLRNNMPDSDEKQAYATWLFKIFPEQDDSFYQRERVLPPVTAEDINQTPALIFHVSCFGFDAKCSMKPYPSYEVTDKILDEVMMDGFITNGDPLLLTQPPSLIEHLQPLLGTRHICSACAVVPWLHKRNGKNVHIAFSLVVLLQAWI